MIVLCLIVLGSLCGYLVSDYVKAKEQIEAAEAIGIKTHYISMFISLPEDFKAEFTNDHIISQYNHNPTFRAGLRIASTLTDEITTEEFHYIMEGPLEYTDNLEGMIKKILEGKTEEIIQSVNSYIEKPEYFSFEQFLIDQMGYVKLGNEDWEQINTYAIVSYIDHFQDEIAEKGLTKVVSHSSCYSQ